MKKNARILLCFSVSGLPWALAAPALAASQPAATNATLEEIVVTAQRREENLQTVPVSVTSVSADELATSNIRSVQDLTQVVSGYIGPGDNGMQSSHLRGIGASVIAPGVEKSVALYVDGVYIGSTVPGLLNLNNVQQIEVLKGPQGTLFGRNTTGGLIQITTRNPGDAPATELEVGRANFQTTTASAYFNVPVSSSVATNLAIQTSNQGIGWGHNTFNGKDVYRVDLSLALRNKWNIHLGDATELQIVGDYEKRNENGTFAYRPITGTTLKVVGGPPIAPPQVYTYTSQLTGWDVYSATDQTTHSLAYGASARLSHDFGFATLSDTLAWRDSTFNLDGFDSDKTPIDQFAAYMDTSNRQWTNELQLASKGTGALQWTVGAFYYHAVNSIVEPLVWGVASPVFPQGKLQKQTVFDSILTQSIAVYGQADYKIAAATTLTAGLRYSHDKNSLDGHNDFIVGGNFFGPGTAFFNPPAVSKSFTKGSPVWRLALTQQFTQDAMGYVSYNRGVKSGGYNPVVTANEKFDEEILDAVEVGSKLTFLDNRARLNTAAFYDKFKNIQVQKFQPAGPPQVYNGAAAKTYGLDVDLELKPLPQLTVRASVELLHSEFTDFTNADILKLNVNPVTLVPTGGYTSGTGSAAGNPLPHAPKSTTSLAVVYAIPVSYGSYDLSGTWSHSAGFTTTPGLEVRQAPYDLYGASLQFTSTSGRYYARFWGANLSNSEVAMNLTVSGTGTVIGLLAPRTMGLTVGAKFN